MLNLAELTNSHKDRFQARGWLGLNGSSRRDPGGNFHVERIGGRSCLSQRPCTCARSSLPKAALGSALLVAQRFVLGSRSERWA